MNGQNTFLFVITPAMPVAPKRRANERNAVAINPPSRLPVIGERNLLVSSTEPVKSPMPVCGKGWTIIGGGITTGFSIMIC